MGAENMEPNKASLIERLDHDLRATVHVVRRVTPTIVEPIVHAPAAARAFRPGQFFRLQNFEVLAPKANGTRLATEALALTGAWFDADRGLVSTIILEMGVSSDLCASFRPADPVILMGPTGVPSEIAPDVTPGRPQDCAFVGNIVEAMQAYGRERRATAASSWLTRRA
jgi:NAD(P)H-flavin reductase